MLNDDQKCNSLSSMQSKGSQEPRTSPSMTFFTPLHHSSRKHFHKTSTTPTDKQVLCDTLILQLRLTTLMRSVDVANIVWGLFVQDETFSFEQLTKMERH